MPITEEKIRALATNDQVYRRGVKYAKAQNVRNVTMAPEASVTEYRARIRGVEDYIASVWLENVDGSIADYECSCPAYDQYPGICKHLVALLTILMDLVKKPPQSVTDRIGKQIIQQYTRQAEADLAREVDADDTPAEIVPVIRLDRGMLRLRLRLGRSRLYYLKSFDDFYDSFRYRQTTTYGAQLTLRHAPENFLLSAQPLLQFLLDFISIRRQDYASSTYYYSSARMGNEIELAGAPLDDFFESAKDCRMIFVPGGRDKEFPLRLSWTPPQMSMRLKDEGVTGMQIAFQPPPYAKGRSHIYLLDGETLHAGDADCLHALGPLLDQLRTYNRDILIDRQDMEAFFQNVYQRLRPYISLEGDSAIATEFAPRTPVFRIALDSAGRGGVTARLTFAYDGEEVDPASEASDVRGRDLREELRLRLLAEKQFQGQREDGLYIFEGDDEALYGFLTEGLSALSRLGEIYISDRLKRYAENPPPASVHASVSLSANLLALQIDVDGFPLEELADVLQSYRLRRRFYRLKNGQFLRLEDDALSDLAEIAETLRLSAQELTAGEIQMPRYRALDLDALLRERQAIAFERDDQFKALVRTVRSVADSDYPVPPSLRKVLRNYQKTGYRWMRTLDDAGFAGILADDMGLGKTLQVLALLYAKKLEKGVRAIIVCPSSLVLNWEAEIQRFCPELRALVVKGPLAQRQELIGSFEEYDVLLTSYAQLRRDIEQCSEIPFDYAIIDEAQMIKNAHTQSAKAVKALQASHRFALTGTPIENRLSELWSIFDFLMPGYFFSYGEFKKGYEQPAVKQGDEAALQRIQRMSAPFVLRRLKRDVLQELPPKTETIRIAELTGEQRKLYIAQALQVRQEIAQNVENQTLKGNTLQILAQLTRLRQICCDPRLFLEDYNKESAKLELCMDLLEEAVSGGHKVLLFSQFTSMLDILRGRLSKVGISSYTLQGSTPKEERHRLVTSFQSDGDAQVFLISLKAGGLGLNLTSADIVILYDPWWNTAAETQAADRAYRIGQTRSVQVFRLIMKDTIEERILQLQEKKKDLADSIITQGNALQTLTEEDWLSLIADRSISE